MPIKPEQTNRQKLTTTTTQRLEIVMTTSFATKLGVKSDQFVRMCVCVCVCVLYSTVISCPLHSTATSQSTHESAHPP